MIRLKFSEMSSIAFEEYKDREGLRPSLADVSVNRLAWPHSARTPADFPRGRLSTVTIARANSAADSNRNDGGGEEVDFTRARSHVPFWLRWICTSLGSDYTRIKAFFLNLFFVCFYFPFLFPLKTRVLAASMIFRWATRKILCSHYRPLTNSLISIS